MALLQRLRVQGQVFDPREMGVLGNEMSWNLGIGIKTEAVIEAMAGAEGLRVV